MRGPAILVVLLAIGFVGYVVYSQVTAHAPIETQAESEGAAERPGPPTPRQDADGLVVPDDPDPRADRERPDAATSGHERTMQRWLDKLRNGNATERFDAAKELGELEAEAAIEDLGRLLAQDRDFYVRLGAAQALGRIGSWDGTGALISALEDRDELVRTAADEALAAITGHRVDGFEPGDPAERRRAWRQAWERWVAANRPADK